MRCLFEVIATGVDIAKFPRRNGAGTDEVPFVWISGLDTDYMDSLTKIKIFRPKNLEALKALAQKGNRLTVKFRRIKSDDKFEHCTVITVNEEDIQPHVQPNVQAAQPFQAGNGVQASAPMALAA
jgi:hypothetical protein